MEIYTLIYTQLLTSRIGKVHFTTEFVWALWQCSYINSAVLHQFLLSHTFSRQLLYLTKLHILKCYFVKRRSLWVFIRNIHLFYLFYWQLGVKRLNGSTAYSVYCIVDMVAVFTYFINTLAWEGPATANVQRNRKTS
jgi:hypothetical protein